MGAQSTTGTPCAYEHQLRCPHFSVRSGGGVRCRAGGEIFSRPSFLEGVSTAGTRPALLRISRLSYYSTDSSCSVFRHEVWLMRSCVAGQCTATKTKMPHPRSLVFSPKPDTSLTFHVFCRFRLFLDILVSASSLCHSILTGPPEPDVGRC